MVDIIFYEKPGCINNTKQKKLLSDAGHSVESRNLLTEKWGRQSLLDYFDLMSVTMWFNKSAPDISSGKIDPSVLSEDEALDLMIAKPILIRRPLMRVGDQCWVGFETSLVDQWIGLTGITNKDDLESCPQKTGHSCNLPGS